MAEASEPGNEIIPLNEETQIALPETPYENQLALPQIRPEVVIPAGNFPQATFGPRHETVQDYTNSTVINNYYGAAEEFQGSPSTSKESGARPKQSQKPVIEEDPSNNASSSQQRSMKPSSLRKPTNEDTLTERSTLILNLPSATNIPPPTPDLFVFDESIPQTLHACELKVGKTKWRKMASYSNIVRSNPCTFSAVAAGDSIYALTWRKWCYIIQPYVENPTWYQIERMQDGHGPCPPAAAIKDCVYVCGGGWKESKSCVVDEWTMDRFSTKCEKFDPSVGNWSPIADLKTPRRLNTVVASSGTLYCIGGLGQNDSEDETSYDADWGEGIPLPVVEKYNFSTSTDKWVTVASMKTPRVAPAAAAHKGRIYVLGGGYLNNWLSTAECYNERSNTWTKLKGSMVYPRIKFTAFVLKKHLYVVGGDRLSTVQKRSLEDDYGEWKEVNSLLDGKDINAMASVIMRRPL